MRGQNHIRFTYRSNCTGRQRRPTAS